MLGFNSWRLFKFLATFLCTVGIISLALAYFIPAPPTTVTIATAFKGSTFVYYGEKYREIFARSHVMLELRETNGAVDNLRLLQDPKSGVDIGFVNGGVSQGNPPPGLLADPHSNMKGSSPCRTNRGKALIDAISWSRLSAHRLRSRLTLVPKVPTKQILRYEERFIPET
jgi:hypothetical protein